ncbi:MAG: GAF domain-containing protein [Sulfurimonas sp.]|nr:GAF domain-containing protein [Sulfurimonas sp.]
MNKYKQLTSFGQDLLGKNSLIDAVSCISQSAKNIIGADRCSLFIYNIEEDELWTTLADGIQKIVIPFDMGIVGQTIRLKKPIIENDPYGNVNFLFDVDIETGYYTQNILTVPIFNLKREVIGVLEFLNKEDSFNDEDLKFMILFSEYVSNFIVKNPKSIDLEIFK